MNSKNIIVAVITLGIFSFAAGIGFLIIKSDASKQFQQINPNSSESSIPTNSATETSKAVTIILTKSGFEPAKVNIKTGQRIVWLNNSGTTATVNSANHPSHTAYSPLNLGEFSDGGKVELDFSKSGTYPYHDHYHPKWTGVIVVE